MEIETEFQVVLTELPGEVINRLRVAVRALTWIATVGAI